MSTHDAIEVKKDGLRQMQDGTWKLSLTVHPSDMPTKLMTDPMGTRYGMALVQILDNEETRELDEKPKRKPADTRAEKARRLCGVVQFQEWVKARNGAQHWPPEWHNETARYQQVSFWVKQECGVGSKAQLDPSWGVNVRHHKPAAAWDTLLADYEQSTGRMAEKH